MSTVILTQKDVRELVSMDLAVPAVEAAFAAHARGETQMPSKVYLDLQEHRGDFRAMPAYFEGSSGVKWVNSHPENPQRHGLPSVMGMYILSDPATALPLAVMDATWLTAVRTGAAGGVASKHLARPGARTLGLIGCGVQARVLLEAHRVVFDQLEVLAADRSAEAAEAFAAECGGRAVPLEEAAAADMVCTATPSRSPVVMRDFLSKGAHLNAMGADAHGKQELDPAILNDAKVFLDDQEQGRGSGEVNVPLHEGSLNEEAIRGTIGDVIAGTLPGREGDEWTVFDSTGLAIQDVALARVVYDQAKARGMGTEIDFVDIQRA